MDLTPLPAAAAVICALLIALGYACAHALPPVLDWRRYLDERSRYDGDVPSRR